LWTPITSSNPVLSLNGKRRVTVDLLFEATNSGKEGAVLSACRNYRYRLDRWWSDEGDCVVWVMLNPSTADATTDDPTIRKCIGFSRRWGYGRLIVVNLFALRATDPAALAGNTDAVGVHNDWHITTALEVAAEVIVAWGCQQHMSTEKLKQRPTRLAELIRSLRPDVEVSCLGYRKDGAPRHPLMLAYTTKRQPWLLS
jgi:hypothetical protein